MGCSFHEVSHLLARLDLFLEVGIWGDSNLGLSTLRGQWLEPGGRPLNLPFPACTHTHTHTQHTRGPMSSVGHGVPEPASGPLFLKECAHCPLLVHGAPHQGTDKQTWPQSPSGLMWGHLDDTQPFP